MPSTARLLRTLVAATLFACAGAGVAADQLNTRYGSLRVSGDSELLLNNKLLTPVVVGNTSLNIEESVDLGQQVLVLTINRGGTACPALFNFVTLDARAARTFPTFGTCSDIYQIRQSNRSVIVTMQGQDGLHEYVFADGVLTDNGSVVPPLGAQPFTANAVINDPDGYTNVRQQPNGKSQIIARISEGQGFTTHPQSAEWWQVKLGNGAIGYMHKSRIVLQHQSY